MEKEHFLLSCSPVLDIDGVEAVIIHIDKAKSRYFEHVDVQMPGYHVLNRIGFKEPDAIRTITQIIDENLSMIWEMAWQQT